MHLRRRNWVVDDSMFIFMACFSEFIGFIIFGNVRVSFDFVYGKDVGPLLYHLDHFRENGFVRVVGT